MATPVNNVYTPVKPVILLPTVIVVVMILSIEILPPDVDVSQDIMNLNNYVINVYILV